MKNVLLGTTVEVVCVHSAVNQLFHALETKSAARRDVIIRVKQLVIVPPIRSAHMVSAV